MKAAILVTLSVCALLAACGSYSLSTNIGNNVETASASRTQRIISALEENVEDTDLTVKVRIGKISLNDTAEPDLEVVTFESEVLDVLKGSLDGNAITFQRYIEAGEGTIRKVGDLLIVSLCRDDEGIFYLPDVGYDFLLSDEMLNITDGLVSTDQGKNKAVACE